MSTADMTLCPTCRDLRDNPLHRLPAHLVHPEHGKPDVFDVHGRAKCPTCGAMWRRDWRGVRLVTDNH